MTLHLICRQIERDRAFNGATETQISVKPDTGVEHRNKHHSSIKHTAQTAEVCLGAHAVFDGKHHGNAFEGVDGDSEEERQFGRVRETRKIRVALHVLNAVHQNDN